MAKARVAKVSVAVLVGVTLGALALTVMSRNTGYQALAGDSAPAQDAALSLITAPGPSAEATYFKIGFLPLTDTFTIMLTDTIKTQEARDIVSGVQTDAVSLMGTIIKTSSPYNPYWSYHLDPASISFFHSAIAVCDASPQYVEDHLGEVGGAILPGSTWCPWSSRVVDEVGFHSMLLPILLSSAPGESEPGNEVHDASGP